MKKFLLSVTLCFLVISHSLKSQSIEVNSTSYTQNFSNSPTHNKIVVGYYAQWAIYARDYNVLDIEADKLTHLMYAFFDTKYDANTDRAWIESLDSYADFEHNESGMHPSTEPIKGNIGDLRILKQQYPHLKILISLGGWTRSQHFPALANSENGRLTLAQSMVNFMQTHTWIDGFDIDWEFPVEGGVQGETVNGSAVPDQPHLPDDHKNLVFMLKKIREVFDTNNMQDKLLTMAAGNNVNNLLRTHVGPGTEGTHSMTENIFDFCDFVTFFGYDFGGNWFDKTCYNAPLYGGDHPDDPLNRGEGNPNQVLNDLIGLYLNEMAVPKEKLIMGIPFYGKLFEGVATTGVIPELPGLYEAAPRVNNSACNNPQPPQGSWDSTNCENSGSIEFCDLYQGIASNVHHYLDANDPNLVSSTAAANGWVRYWDDTAKVPYLYNATENKFISYDDPESIDLKVKYALSKELGGVMIWELSQDARQSDKGLLDVIDQTLLNSTYDIVLNFKDQNQVALQGVSVELKDEQGTVLETLTTDTNGQVLFDDKTAYLPYTINYSFNNYSFLPSSVSFAASEFNSNKTIDILGSNQTSSIAGSVKENGQLLTDISVILKDSNNQELEKITSTDGNFSFNAVIDGYDYSITAEKEYYTFSSISYTNLNSDQVNQEIIGTRNTHNISGTITSSGSGLQGVSVSIVGNGQTYSETTDTNGGYAANNLPAGYDYTVTPTSGSVVFKPTSRTLTLLNSDATADFTENTGLIYGTVKDGTTPVSGAKVSLVVPWTNGNPYKSISKTTNAQGEYFYTETELDGYNTITSLKLETWENNNVTYYPTDLAGISITTTPQEFNFNSQPVTPEITINDPNTSVVNNTYGSNVALEALVALSFDDGSTTLSSVVFKVNGTVVSATNNGNTYSASWSPADSDYGNLHAFIVEAESSNGETASESFNFTLNCSGTSCPNIAPQIVWNSPSNTNINQNQGFQSIPIEVTVSDTDGTVASVTITINGATHNMTSGTNDTYSYNFTPTNHQQYPLTITATDNDGDANTLAETLNITNSQFVPLPSGNIILGFAHSWHNANAPYIYFKDMASIKYNVVIYSFIETSGNYYTPILTTNNTDPQYLTNGSFDSQKLKQDIQDLRDQGIPVLVSIGGQNGHVELTTESEKDTFVQGVIDIIDLYGFDGIDVDLEGSSMNFQAGDLTDFTYASVSAYPRLKYMIDAIKEIVNHYGEGFHLTSAPETQYVQGGYQIYADSWGSFLPVIHNLRQELDLLMVQLYNTGTVLALDGKSYGSATPDFLTSMSDMLINGFNVGGSSTARGINFPGLPASKIMVGIPSCPSAAGSGYIVPSETIKALDYLRFGTDFTGRNYTLQNGAHPGLRGVMTWSINWDAASGCASAYEFSNSYDDYFFGNLSNTDFEFENNDIILFPNPLNTGKLTIKTRNQLSINSITIFNVLGKTVFESNRPKNTLDLEHLDSGLYLVKIETDKNRSVYKKIIKE